jgi:chromosomal replication initiation ATPase DnaA
MTKAVDRARELAPHESDLEALAVTWGATLEEVRGPSRHAELMEARRAIADHLSSRGCSLKTIGAAVHRHHTTVINLLKPKRQGAPRAH